MMRNLICLDSGKLYIFNNANLLDKYEPVVVVTKIIEFDELNLLKT